MSPDLPLRILVVANKTWECEPVVNAIAHKDARPKAIQQLWRGYDPLEIQTPVKGHPVRGNLPPRPRLGFAVGQDRVEVWCIEDWMWTERPILDSSGHPTAMRLGASSSYEKLTGSLPVIARNAFGGTSPDLVIAMGTAGIPSAETLNGCVTIGSRCYIQNPWADAPACELNEQVAKYGPLLGDEIAKYTSNVISSPQLSPELFINISVETRFAAEARFLAPPVHPATPLRILAGHGYAALSTININNYDDYIWADEETLEKFGRSIRQREIGSMETTHALIRINWPSTPFLFVSGLTDRVPMFNAEVTPRKYSQNFAPAHNAGVAIAHLVPELSRLHHHGGLWA